MFIVVSNPDLIDRDLAWYLRGTAWTGDPARADRFESREGAQAAIERAKKFSGRKAWKTWTIIPAP